MSLNRTPLAAFTCDDDDGQHIYLYYQAPNGDIKEAIFDEASNWAPNPQNTSTVGTAKLNTGLAVISWDVGQQVRVYYLGQESKIVERCNNGQGGWDDGELTGKYQAAPYSKIAAVNLSKTGANIHVYYQDSTNKLRETISIGDWPEGTTRLPVAVVGTSIAASINFDPNRSGQIWLYYQDTDLTLKEKWYSGSNDNWSTGSFKATNVFPPGASLSAALWGFQNDRVASVDENNQLCVTPCSGPWNSTVNIGQVTITLSDVVLISVGGGSEPASALRMFFQEAGGAITHFASSDGDTWSLVTQNILG
ncbi:fucose-specific lectin [Pluteus cervinus]|uniref:Fucose-specific lectin n=1 Tax=Pluteus cervinus TaxID=181527 RepID=A0ACD3ADL5_9AGAR|nr:fucose-specific lectin [Pluteus cervinus]